MIALAVIALAVVLAPGPAAAVPACERSMQQVRERLAEEPVMRDEAYTAVMLQQLAAAEASAAGDDAGCVLALETARLILKLPPAAGQGR